MAFGKRSGFELEKIIPRNLRIDLPNECSIIEGTIIEPCESRHRFRVAS